MTTLLDDPSVNGSTTAAQRLRTTMAAVRLSISWFGVRKTLTPQQKEQAADAFGAEGSYVSAAKKLLDTSHPAYKAVTGVRTRVLNYWKGMTLPFPEPGIRLIRQDDLATFDVHMTTLRAELDEAVQQLDEHFAELKQSARQRLGNLYNSEDYPSSLRGLFRVEYDFPSVEPPEYLRQLSPQLYAEECQRVQARFDEAVKLAEQAFLEEFARSVEHLTERLSGQVDGKQKIFRDSAIENLTEFFERFRHLNVGSDEQLNQLVQQAQRTVRGVEAQQLRDSQELRQRVATQLSGVQSVLDGLLVDRPRRNIIRRPR